jgi:hypothetical protein
MAKEETPKVETWLTISPYEITLAVIPGRSVAMQLRIHPDHLHLAPRVGVALRMTAAQAREIATKLKRKADEAEEGLPRA